MDLRCPVVGARASASMHATHASNVLRDSHTLARTRTHSHARTRTHSRALARTRTRTHSHALARTHKLRRTRTLARTGIGSANAAQSASSPKKTQSVLIIQLSITAARRHHCLCKNAHAQRCACLGAELPGRGRHNREEGRGGTARRWQTSRPPVVKSQKLVLHLSNSSC